MSNRTELSRRTFLRVVGGMGAGFALGIYPALGCGKANAEGAAFVPNAFVKVDPDGMITVTVTKSDMGQGVRTSFAMIVAEEMDADWKKVKVVQAPADPESFRKYGGQGTGGSGSIRGMHKNLRDVGAGARAMLVAAAAKGWGVDPATCTTADGKVFHKASGKSIAYGELTGAAAGMPVPDGDVPHKSKSEYKLVGKGAGRVDNPDVVKGTAIYGLDVKVDNMAYAVIARPPAFGASVEKVDDAAARKVPGVIDVFQVGSGVAVVASNTWAALKGREALNVTWNMGPNAELSSAKITEQLHAAVGDHLELPAGDKVLEARFDLPYLAHATMEPMNAVADVRDGRATVWAGTQTPDSAQGQVARALGITPGNVTVNVALLGGGFGRRLSNDYILEACEISKAAKRPVKLTWTREDDTKHDRYRPASHHALKGVLDASGNPIGWSHQAFDAGRNGGPLRYQGAGIWYAIGKSGMARSGVNVDVPTGAWRSVENTQLNVVNECFIDELAQAAGKDPFEFRQALIRDERLKKVLETAAEKSGWGKPLPKGHGRGIACFQGYGSYAAHVIELSVEDKEIKLHRAVCVVDCGEAINPKGVEAQMQGGCTDGLSTALKAAITIDKGGVEQSTWVEYEWMTIDQMPVIEVHIIPSQADPGGMGEVGYPSVAPAVANAVFAATGKRVRKFPIKVDELV